MVADFDILEVSVADFRPLVPSVHGVDRLCQLSAASLVDAARVDPYVRESILLGLLARVDDFVVACSVFELVLVVCV